MRVLLVSTIVTQNVSLRTSQHFDAVGEKSPVEEVTFDALIGDEDIY